VKLFITPWKKRPSGFTKVVGGCRIGCGGIRLIASARRSTPSLGAPSFSPMKG
jgi:hypothetical protein